MREGDSPRFTNGLIAAGQGNVAKVGRPLHVAIIANQKLAAPNRSISPVAAPVEANSDDRLNQSMFRHAAGYVGVMVLYCDNSQSFPFAALFGIARRGVGGMQIVDHHARVD